MPAKGLEQYREELLQQFREAGERGSPKSALKLSSLGRKETFRQMESEQRSEGRAEMLFSG
ncbi:MAG: hypothetical protein ACOX5R_19705 [bacterium]